MPIGVKDLNNGYAQIVDPVAEISKQMITSYNENIDKYVFSNLNTDNNYIHIEEPKLLQITNQNIGSISIECKMIATKTIDKVFAYEKPAIDLQSIRTYFYEYDIDYKSMTFEELKQTLRRLMK